MRSICFRLLRRLDMSDLSWLKNEQMAGLEPHIPRSHSRPWVNE